MNLFFSDFSENNTFLFSPITEKEYPLHPLDLSLKRIFLIFCFSIFKAERYSFHILGLGTP